MIRSKKNVRKATERSIHKLAEKKTIKGDEVEKVRDGEIYLEGEESREKYSEGGEKSRIVSAV